MEVLSETGLLVHNTWSSFMLEIVFLASLKRRRKHFLADLGILQDSYIFRIAFPVQNSCLYIGPLWRIIYIVSRFMLYVPGGGGIYIYMCVCVCGGGGGWSGSSVGIATDYGLEGPGSNPCGDEIFRPFWLVLGAHPASWKWVPGLSRG